MVENNSHPLVSFVVNCYNGEKYLHQCLKSILSQTYSNWELIFWDNASTDNSPRIFHSYNDKRFRYFRSESNVTLGQARAWAVEKSRGEYIAFLDVDDEWLPKKTEIQVERMIKDSSVLSYGGIIEIYENSNKKNKIILPKHQSSDNFRDNLEQFEIQMPTVMLAKKTLLKKRLNFDPNITASEEYCLGMQLIYKENVSVIKMPLAKYLVSPHSLTNKNSAFWAKERIFTLKKLIADHPEIELKYKNELQEAYDRAEYYKARHFMFVKNRRDAIKVMNKIKFHKPIYFVLSLMIHFPFVWNKLHKIKNYRG